MLDPAYLKELLSAIHSAGYSGVDVVTLYAQFVSDHERSQPRPGKESQKLRYHMQEMWLAGLFRRADNQSSRSEWGLIENDNCWTLIPIPLVLTPSGSKVLGELQEPKGEEALQTAIQGAAGGAQAEALRTAIQTLAQEQR